MGEQVNVDFILLVLFDLMIIEVYNLVYEFEDYFKIQVEFDDVVIYIELDFLF